MPDPPLTDQGLKQCLDVLENFPHMASITHVLCSPLRRTLETALFSFQPLYVRGLKAIAWGDLKEWGFGPCNIGAPVDKLQSRMALLPVDLRALAPGWELKEDIKGDRFTRVDLVRKELYSLVKCIRKGHAWKGIPMKQETGRVEILVVSHGSFLSSLMGEDSKFHLSFRCCDPANSY